MWYWINYARTFRLPMLLDFFVVPPSQAAFKTTGQQINAALKFVFEPVTDKQREAVESGKASVMMYNFYTDGALNILSTSQGGFSPKSEDIGREYTHGAGGPAGGSEQERQAGGAYAVNPSPPGVYDLAIMPYMYVDYGTPQASIIAAGTMFIVPACVGYMVSRAEIKRLFDSLVDSLKGYVTELFNKVRTYVESAEGKYLDSTFPSAVAAGEPFQASHQIFNAGSPGKIELKMTADGVSQSFPLKIDRTASISESLSMPWDDLSRNYLFELLSPAPSFMRAISLRLEGYDYKPLGFPRVTDSKSFSTLIEAGFPIPALGEVSAPSFLKPGDAFSLDFPITNEGYKGDVGVRIIAPGFQEDVMQRIDSGATITPKYSGEMPVAESYKITVVPISFGRNKQVVEGTPRTVEISPINALFHEDMAVKLLGGYAERNEFTAFVAGKNVTVRGLTVTPGTGPLPFGYAGYMLTGTLGEGESAEITYDELYFLRVDTVRGIATARRGALIERNAKLYEYSAVPIPAMAINSLKSFGSLFTKKSTRLEVG